MSRKHQWVLIIEDDAFINKAYEAKFGIEKIDVKFAIDGVDAMSMLRATTDYPDLILLDLMRRQKSQRY
jgi:DNA-binding response OmpR family regulator